MLQINGKNEPFRYFLSTAGEVVEGERGRHNFVHNIVQSILGLFRKDTSSSDYNRIKYQ